MTLAEKLQLANPNIPRRLSLSVTVVFWPEATVMVQLFPVIENFTFDINPAAFNPSFRAVTMLESVAYVLFFTRNCAVCGSDATVSRTVSSTFEN